MTSFTTISLISIVTTFLITSVTQYDNTCSQLAAIYSDLTSLSNSTTDAALISNQWTKQCVMSSCCIFSPEKLNDVSHILWTLKCTETKFAVQSSEHMPVVEASAISDGVLISMTDMNMIKLANEQKTAQIGPGLMWGAVYDWISPYSLDITGRRFGPVGISELLLGSDISYFGSQVGWSANTVTSYKVVLANSSVVYANRNSHSDLFWALKSDSSNFGIVTRFDMNTYPVTSIFGGTIEYDTSYINTYLDAVASYVAPGGSCEDPLAAIDSIMLITPSTGIFLTGAVLFHRGSDPAPASLSNFTKIPSIFTDISLHTSFANFTDETNTAMYSSNALRQAFWVTTLKAVPESVYLANQTFFPTTMAQLKNIPNLTTSITFQPITKAWLEAARASSGDAIDLDPANRDFFTLLVSTDWTDPAYDQLVTDFSTSILAEIDANAKAAGVDYPFQYINDTGISEPIFQSYRGGKSLPKLKAICQEYDPSGVFQTLMPGGFKVGF